MFNVGDIVIILKDFPWAAGLKKGQKVRVTGVQDGRDHDDASITILNINNIWGIDSIDAEIYDQNNIDWWINVTRSQRIRTVR